MIGTSLGPYQVVAKLGEGGMGEVYRATDTNLKRQVAIKVLPASLAGDVERLARFQREAEVLAALNHPNIAAIYGLEKTPECTALVMELVEGDDLSQRIARHSTGAHGAPSNVEGRGAIPIDEALPIARQIAEALEAAHELGIIHRDLKPANIKVRPDGTVKVLDFGLAKALDANASSATADAMNSPTITTPAMTQAGMILGTAAYMAPEQARGRMVDRRADIWAFGAVLYEMLAGQRAFEGEDISVTLANVIKDDPKWDALPKDLPSPLRRLLRRCLEKDPKKRLRDIGEARLVLEDPAPLDPSSAAPTRMSSSTVVPAWRRSLPWAMAVTFGVLAAWLAWRGQPTSDQRVTRALIGVAPADRLLSGFSGDPSLGLGRPSRTAMTFSPDGRSLVFSAEREGGVQLYLRRLDQLDAMPIAGTDGASTPFFSPDGQSLGFYAAGALRKVPVGGGPVVELCKTDLVFGASWSRTGQILFANIVGGLQQVSSDGGAAASVTKVETGEVSHRLPQVLPDGDTVLFTVTNGLFPSWDDTRVVAQALTTGTRKVLVEGAADARFVSSGHLVFLRKGTLMAVPFDVRRLVVTGPAVGVVSDVMQAANIQPRQVDSGAGQFAVSSDGALVYATGGVFPQDRWSIVSVDRSGRSEALRVPAGMWQAPRVSPDGRRIAFGGPTLTGDWDVWTCDLQRGAVASVPMQGSESVPVWTPDGSRVAVASAPARGRRGPLALIDPEGRSSAEPLTKTALGYPGSWTPDGREVAFTLAGGDGAESSRSIWIAVRDGKAEPRQILADATEPDFSADGRWIAYASRRSTQAQVFVQPYPALDHRVQVSIDGGTEPAWRRDGRELYYLQNVSDGGALTVRVMAVPVTTTPTFSVGTPHALFEGAFRSDGGSFRNYDVTADGQRFVMVQEVQRPPARVSQMVLVQNWVEELTQRVQAKP